MARKTVADVEASDASKAQKLRGLGVLLLVVASIYLVVKLATAK